MSLGIGLIDSFYFLLLQIILVIGYFAFHINFIIILSLAIKIPPGVFVGVAFNLYTNLGRIGISAMLTLATHKCIMVCLFIYLDQR